MLAHLCIFRIPLRQEFSRMLGSIRADKIGGLCVDFLMSDVKESNARIMQNDAALTATCSMYVCS